MPSWALVSVKYSLKGPGDSPIEFLWSRVEIWEYPILPTCEAVIIGTTRELFEFRHPQSFRNLLYLIIK
jgi:transposase